MSNDKKTEVFDVDKIRQLVELMRENDISELSLQNGEDRIKLERKREAAAVIPAAVVPAAPVPVKAPEIEAASAKPAAEPSSMTTINSTLVGTFYTAAKPGAEPYVKVGDYVSPDQTVCIIEAMKVFNQIQSEISGKIVAVLVKNGDMVEYGTPLYKVDTQA